MTKWFLLVLFAWLLVNQAKAVEQEWWYSPSIPRTFPEGYSQVCFLLNRDAKNVEVYGYRVGEANMYDEDWVTIPPRPLKWYEKMSVHGR